MPARRSGKKETVMRRTRRCPFLFFLLFLLTGCGDEIGSYDHVFSKNGMTFSAPHLTIRGTKEKDMGLVLWTHYVSGSPRCLGAFISDSGDNWSFFPGGNPGAKRPGAAKRMYEIFPGRETYGITIPLGLNDARECTWQLQEIQLLVSDPFINDRTTELFSFMMVDSAELSFFEPRYNVLCRKLRTGYNRLDCRHGSQMGKDVIVYSRTVLQDVHTTVNIATDADLLKAWSKP